MYRVRIFPKKGPCREFTVAYYDYAMERANHYKKNWPLYNFYTIDFFNGEFWEEM